MPEWDQLIKEIANDNKYRLICKGITNNKVLREELYSECIVKLFEYKDEVLKAYSEGYLSVYIYAVIYNLWNHKGDVRKFKGKTSPLYMIAEHREMHREYKNELKRNDNKERNLVREAVTELFKKMQSSKEEERLSAQLLWNVCKTNVYTEAQVNNTSRYQINRRISPILKDLKRKLNE